MFQVMYEMKECTECGSAIPINQENSFAKCDFCGAEYDIINHNTDHQAADHDIIGPWPAFFIGSVLGLSLGVITFTATGKYLAVKAIAKGGRIAEKIVDDWLNAGEKQK